MGGLGPDSHFGTSLIAEENALLLLLVLLSRVHSRYAARITARSVYCKGSIDVASGLVKLNGLPGVFGGLTDDGTAFDDALVLLSVIDLHVLLMNVALDLILTEPQWKIQFKCLVCVLPALRLLKARLI